jgi:gliding-associated putative ABC transporter substrate-binding component GldG
MNQKTIVALAVVGSLVLVNIIGVRAFGRFDLTHEKIYTLSQSSRETMAALEEPVTVSAYFTENLPPPYASNARYVRDLLEEYRAASKGKLSFEFIDPMTQETEKDKAAKKEVRRDIFGRTFREQTSVEKELAQSGVQSVEIRAVQEDQVQTKRAWMGLVIKHLEKKEVIPVVQNVGSLEYDLTSLIRKMTRTRTPVIGIVQGHDEPKAEEKLRNLMSVLSQTYSPRPVELGTKDKVDDDVDALWVIGPKTAFKPNEIKAIDQFLMQGKAVAFFLDVLQVDARTFQTTPAEHGLTPLLASYGVTLGDRLVADAKAAQLSVQEQRGFMMVSSPVLYPFIPMVQRLEADSPVSKGISDLTMPFVTSLTATAGEGQKVTVLARSSQKSWLENKPFNTDPRRDWRSETITPSGPYDLMVQVSGTLKSHFASEALQSAPGAAPLLAQSKSEARLIVVGGSSLLWDEFFARPNQALAMNIADWMLLDPALLAMRNRGMAGSPLEGELSEGKRNAAKFGNALGMPMLLVGFGLVRWRMRESRRRQATV